MRIDVVAAATALALSASLVAPAAHAAPWMPRSAITEIPSGPATQPSFPLALSAAQAQAQLAKIAAWDVTMQSTAPCVTSDAGASDGGDAAAPSKCPFGGIIEVESGPGHAIVESDNTQEAVWLWSFHRDLTKDTTHAPHVASAFEYLAQNPGWLEWQDTSDTGPDYYSLYNCGWGIRAVLAFEQATGDTQHHAYGATCAAQIQGVAAVPATARVIDAATSSWAATALWLWGDHESDAAMKTKAADVGAQAKAWLEASAQRLTTRTWAVTGGAIFFGVVHSYMKEHPAELDAWARAMAPQLGGWIDESQPIGSDWTDWRNAHSAWNMLAQFTASDALGPGAGDANRAIANDILARLVAQDGDDDGAIPGSQQRPAAEDQSWITAYLAYFGLRFAITEPAAGDGGVVGDDAGTIGPSSDAGDGGSGASPGHGDSSSGCACDVARTDSSPWALSFAACAIALAIIRARVRRSRTSL